MTLITSSIEDRVRSFLDYLILHAVHVQDPMTLTEKLMSIARDGPSQFQIVTDFDKTLTPQWLNNPESDSGALVPCHASHGVIETSPFVGPKYSKHTRDLAAYYMPLEHDIRLTNDAKTKICEEWYHKAHTCMLDEKLSSDILDKIVHHCWSSMEIHLRLRTSEVFSVCRALGIPVTVLSAGLADVIERILTLEGIIPQSNVDSGILAVGNRMLFNPDGCHSGFSEPCIHAYNKKHALTQALISDASRAERSNAIVMGDLIADVEFVHSIPHLSRYIAIGFLADGPHHEERLKEYLKHFDIVITGGSASMEVPLRVLEVLFERT
jgi:HAD superfamily hydrolase (TIGR01544 family)